MKKVLFAAALAATFGIFADGIESANIVGYTQKTIPAGKYMMISAQLDKIGGGMMTFDEAFKVNVTGPKAWESEEDEECIPGWYANAPCLKIPNGTVDQAYRDLYWTQNAWDDATESFVEGWADVGGSLVATANMLKGYGVWFVAGSEDVTVTVSGEVLGADSDTITAGTGYNMMKLPFPVELNAGSAKIDWNLSDIAPKAWESEDSEECIEGWTANAPCIKIPNGTVDQAYRDLYYTQNAWDDDKGEFVEGWADVGGSVVVNATIPVGMAFWFVVPSPVTATISK